MPQIISSFLIGSVLDRKSRKLMIIIPDAISALSAALALVFVLHGLDGAILFPLLAIRSFCQGVQTPSANAVIPSLMPEERLVRANGMKGLLSSAVMLLSPALAGFLFSFSYGLVLSLLLDIVTAVLATAMLSFQRIPGGKLQERASMRDGLCYVRRNRVLLFLLIFNALASFAISPGAFMTPLLIGREYDASSSMLSLSEMSYSAGMIIGGVLVSAAGDRIGGRRGYAASLLAYGAFLALIGITRGFPCYLLLNLSIGVSTPFYAAFVNACIQKSTEEGMIGRVMAVLSATSSAALPLGMVLFGPLADILPVRTVFIISGLAAAAIAAIGMHFHGSMR